jgi:hypothetical protein
MKRMLAVAAICFLVFGYTHWKHQHEAMALAQLESGPASSANGFVALPPANGQGSGTVFVVAAQNCPHEDARRADLLAEELSQKGIPVKRVHDVNFSITRMPGQEVLDRLNLIMNSPLPIVFVNGRAKSNPSLDDVVAEFNADQPSTE